MPLFYNAVPEVDDEGSTDTMGSFTRAFKTNNNDDPFSKAPMQKLSPVAPITSKCTLFLSFFVPSNYVWRGIVKEGKKIVTSCVK